MPLNATERPTGKRKETQGIIETSHHGVSFFIYALSVDERKEAGGR